MDSKQYENLTSGVENRVKDALVLFNKQNSQVFHFSHLTSTGQWTVLWNTVFLYLSRRELEFYSECLAAVRVLSRDNTYLNEAVKTEQLNCLINIANIGDNNYNASEFVQVEALKCLCNLIFQSKNAQDMCLTNSSVEGIMRRIKTYKESKIIYDIKYFDMKLLFLLTATNCDIRTKVREDHHGLVYLVETLDMFMNSASVKEFNDKEVELINEVLKVLFNLTVRSSTCVATEEDEESQFQRLAVVIADLLTYKTLNKEKVTSLHSNIVNLLTSVPTACYSELVQPNSGESEKNLVPFEDQNVFTLSILLDFLRRNLNKGDDLSHQYELLSPILTVLIKCVRCCGLNRRYIRSVILPPLTDVKKRPEEGSEIRNYLCKMLTSPATSMADLVAELLFILCKENVGRMIKYTGYGNAAGLFANRGLLGGHNRNLSDQYSSDSEDSDTEEYKQIQHAINPVIGCYEPPRSNPLEGMSEEQKEFEAMKLVELMNQLHKQGIVQPCRIGEDGRPQPVEHILQLQEEIPEQQRDHRRKT